MDVDEIVADILSRKNLDGVTITGGEPLNQSDTVTELCEKLFDKISIFLITGYDIAQSLIDCVRKYHYPTFCHQYRILNNLDILCSGPFKANKICSGEWKGSSNQEIRYLTERGRKQALMPVIPKEIIIQPNGTTIETGFTI